ncbi:MAG: hypothetical protein QT05_C0051G0040 [archaeon GW2011_AR13]|nr:MAG: hypothetical protein QT05_C0051G0040 [archaeon GW2011_AR13]
MFFIILFMTDIGCKYKSVCSTYKGKFDCTPLYSKNFRNTCDKANDIDVLCPMYGLYEQIDSLNGANKSLLQLLNISEEKI